MRNMGYREIHVRMMDALNERPGNTRKLDALNECRRGEWLRFKLIADGRRTKLYWGR